MSFLFKSWPAMPEEDDDKEKDAVLVYNPTPPDYEPVSPTTQAPRPRPLGGCSKCRMAVHGCSKCVVGFVPARRK